MAAKGNECILDFIEGVELSMSSQVQPRILSGFMELLPEDQILFNQMVDTIRAGYEKFGFLPLDTPTIELSEVLLAIAGG